jgi:3-oxoadipate enol-lactonase
MAFPRISEPPIQLPPGRIVHVPGRGELFLRDSGGDGPPVLLLHGWMFSADLNWWRCYEPLERAGYRVLAVDHRGHGRGVRSPVPFQLADCAADAAALLREIGVPQAVVVGYSMGGPIAQLMARDHGDLVSGLVLCATAARWNDRRQKLVWRTLALIRLALGLAPDVVWHRGLRAAGFPDSPTTTWTASELTRGSARDLAEAGRELSRFDSRGWVGAVTAPSAVVVTTKDDAVPARHQRQLAQLLAAETFEVAGDHSVVIARAREFNAVLQRALGAVQAATGDLAAA